MKTLQKAEMLKRDQVRSTFYQITDSVKMVDSIPSSLPMCEPNVTYWPSPILHGWSNYSTRSRIVHTYISSWNSFLAATL
jgi:hypothetical protein